MFVDPFENWVVVFERHGVVFLAQLLWNQNFVASFEFQHHQLLYDVILLENAHTIMRSSEQLHSKNQVELVESRDS